MNQTQNRQTYVERARRWGSYALGILIECVAAAALSAIALLVIIIIKAIMT